MPVRKSRIDRVDFLVANQGVRLWRVRTGGCNDLADDRRDRRVGAVPAVVRLEDESLALRPRLEVVRAVGDRTFLVAVARITADTVGPHAVPRHAVDREGRIDVAEEVLVVGERLVPIEGDRLLAVLDSLVDEVIAGRRGNVVARLEELLPRPDEVIGRDGVRRRAVTDPVPVRVRADVDVQIGRRRLDGRGEVKHIRALLDDHVVAANDRRRSSEVRSPCTGEVLVREVEPAGIVCSMAKFTVLLDMRWATAMLVSAQTLAANDSRWPPRQLLPEWLLAAAEPVSAITATAAATRNQILLCIVPSVWSAPGALGRRRELTPALRKSKRPSRP